MRKVLVAVVVLALLGAVGLIAAVRRSADGYFSPQFTPDGAAGGSPESAGGAGACPAGQKDCTGQCMPPNPGIGCALTGCDRR